MPLRKFTDLFFSLRPVILIPVWGFSIFGFFRTSNIDITKINQYWLTFNFKIYLAILFFSLSVGVVYILNQLADIEVDKKNGGLPLIASGIVSQKSAWLFAIVCTIVSISVPLLTQYRELSLFAIITIIIGYLYSFKPFFFSGRLFFDFLSNALGYGVVAFGVGWYVGGGNVFTLHFLTCALPYFLLMCSGSINSTLPDIEGDRAEGKMTTAVVIGRRQAHLLSTLILVLAGITAVIQRDPLASLCAILSLPMYVLYIFKQKTVFMEATYKIGGALCMVCAFAVMPLFMGISLFIFLITRIYFKIRHNVEYPSMVPSK